jgi:hypothetical protein
LLAQHFAQVPKDAGQPPSIVRVPQDSEGVAQVALRVAETTSLLVGAGASQGGVDLVTASHCTCRS